MLNNFIDLTGLETFVSKYLTDTIDANDVKHATSSKGVIDYVANEIDTLADSINTSLNAKISKPSSSVGSSDTPIYYDSTGTFKTVSPYTSGAGITVDGKTINHSNSITAGTVSEGGKTRTLGYGGSFKVPSINYDGQGHITGSGSVTITLPSSDNTDTKVTSAENHYTPEEYDALNSDASSSTSASWGSTALVTGVNIGKDEKGHITSLSVDSIKLPSNPNTWRSVKVGNNTLSDTTTPLTVTGSGATSVSLSGGTLTIDSTDTKYTGNSPITVSGTTITHNTSGVTEGTANEGGSSRTLVHGESFNVPSVTVDKYGHVTSRGTTTLKLPADTNTWRPVTVGETSIEGNDLTLTAGTNVTLGVSDGTVTINSKCVNTEYTFSEGSSNGTFTVTPSNGSAQPVSIKGLGSLAYKNSLSASEVDALPEDTAYIKSITKSGDTLTITPSAGDTFTFTGATTTLATTSTDGLMSASDKSKLNSIDEGAEVNVIETVKVNGTALTPSSKAVNVTVPTKVSQLTDASSYAKTSTTLSGYGIIDAKIDTTTNKITLGENSIVPLTSHQDISGKENTSNKVSTWSATTSNTKYPSEKLVKDSLDAKSNTGHTHTKSEITDLSLATVATSGKYSDLTGTPTIPTVDSTLSETSTNAIQNKEVTTALEGKASKSHTHTKSEISDFPTLASVATSGSYNDLSGTPTIPTVDSSLSSTSTNAIQNKAVHTALSGKSDTGHKHTKSEITDFPTLATVATSGSYADLSNKPSIPTVDSELDADSTNAIQNSAVKSALDSKANSSHTHTIANITSLQTTLDSKAGKATTLSGYGITDAKISNGTITLGSNTITPLTSHQNISGKADKATTLSGYGITNAYTKDEIDTKLASSMKYKGQKDTYSDLPETGNSTGDVWDVKADGHNYAWNGTSWDDLGGTVDLSGYYDKTTTDTLLGKKADKATTLSGYGITDAKISSGTITLGGNTITPLTSHQDISGKADKATTLAGYGITDAKISSGTITLGSNSITPLTSHQSISGKENISNKVSSWSTTTTNTNYPSEKLVKDSLDGKANSSHTHTKSQISDFPTLATVATSGSYSDLSNKPSIPSVDSLLSSTSTNAIQNKAVYTALSGKSDTGHKHTKSEITDFPTLATVATSGSYSDLSNKPSIPSVDSLLNSTSTNAIQNKAVYSALSSKSATGHKHTKSEITDFPTLATVATSGSYNDLSNKPSIPTVDSELDADSTNAIQNSVVKSALDGKASSSHSHAISDITSLQTTLNGKASKATTLSGYGITDASIDTTTNTISIGGNSITPLTSIPTASGSALGGVKIGSNLSIANSVLSVPVTNSKATLTYGNSSTIAKIGDTPITLTMPAQYSHPAYTTVASGLYKITVDSTGHVSGATAVTKTDISNLGVKITDTNTWRAINVNGTEAIKNNASTTLNFADGNNVSLSYDSGTLTINSSYSNTWRGVTVNGVNGSSALGNDTGTEALAFTTGSTSGTISVAGTDVAVKGLGSLAYKSSLSASDIPSITKSKISDFPTIPTVATSYSTTGTTAFTAKALATANAVSALLNCLDTESSTPTDADYYIAQYAGGGTTTTSYHRRPVSALYSYMKSKMDSVYSPKAGSSSITAIGTLSSGTVPVARISGLGSLATISTNSSTSNYLRGDGKWVTPPNTTYGIATTSANGLMSSTDKSKLDGIDSGAQVNVIETVKVNGTALTSSSKAVDITVPTKVSQLTDASSYAKTSTSLSGYGIIDAKIDITTNKITLGENSIVPLTSQDISGKANLSGADFTGVVTINPSTATESTSITTGALKVTGGIGATGNIWGAYVYNAVWNDLADCIPVDEDCTPEAGYCYCFDGTHYYKSNKYCANGIIGINSDTYGMNMGRKPNTKQMDIAVSGFVLAYVDKEYKSGTPLTCTKNGKLTKIRLIDRILHPHKIVATYWKSEPNEEWGSETRKVKVNGRKWVKVK